MPEIEEDYVVRFDAHDIARFADGSGVSVELPNGEEVKCYPTNLGLEERVGIAMAALNMEDGWWDMLDRE